MRKLLDEAQYIDQYLLQAMSTEDKLLFQAQMLTNSALQENVQAQSQAHQLIRSLGRAAKRQQLQTIFDNLCATDPAFQAALNSIFK
ncbi:hypothetical protein SAMN04488505_101475 [Chitinophaga rupis]|uniref:Uncharacterized protein n=1 Tax=Chitinophaga rupis TaxID=573321 RepID=A0A1H7I6W3_9BACT|nr:hypothetical protein [Chitinophaga rupis]SEK58084.1 hypothetical protein SAMN04488505_101475 [Chitinophaga rupis]